MADFRVLLDELGIETASAWCLGCQVRVMDCGLWGSRYEAADATALLRARSGGGMGLFIAGGLGEALGSMVGGGTNVAFKLHTAEGYGAINGIP